MRARLDALALGGPDRPSRRLVIRGQWRWGVMTDLDPENSAEVPGWPSIYIIGSYDSRISFFSQQVRGFNLAGSLVEADMLRGKTRFAVIGAGAAGLSVAAGL